MLQPSSVFFFVPFCCYFIYLNIYVTYVELYDSVYVFYLFYLLIHKPILLFTFPVFYNHSIENTAWDGQVQRHFDHTRIDLTPVERGSEYFWCMWIYNIIFEKNIYCNSSGWRDIHKGQENQRSNTRITHV